MLELKRILGIFIVLWYGLFAAKTYSQTADWQQKVAYQMEVNVKADRHLVEGKQQLVYTNNSPDVLHLVFYHLYFNAFQTTSMMAERNRHLPDADGRIVPRIWNYKPEEEGWQKIKTLTQDGKPVRWEISDTVMKVYLDHPIMPKSSSVFEMTFTSQVPLQTRRSGRDNTEGVDYSMCQWYPKMAQYDQRGWNVDFYVGREFYAPFGTFDVKIKLPAQYVVGGTGVLQNASEVGHGYSDAKPTADSLQWHFKAENVHDFAWVADPEYIHETAKTKDGVPIHLFYLPNAPLSWKNAKTTAVMAIERLSQQFGKYPHPQFTVAQAGDGGMEYPMIIFLAGRGLAIVHEGAHQWFYSILGSDETNYAWMDEGFTQFATTEVNGKNAGNAQPSHLSGFSSILAARKLGFFEPLSTPSDWFDSNAGYSTSAYSGGDIMAEMLQYVIGRENRDKFFLAYFDKYKFKHPAPKDVELVAEQVSGLQLDWFFDQWTLRNWKNDYAIQKMQSKESAEGWQTEILIKRNGRAAMPLDIEIKLEDGSSKWVNIPLTDMMGHKPVPSDWHVATAWAWTFPTYTLKLTFTKKPILAEIDPKGFMLDDNRMNNTSKRRLGTTQFMKPPQPTYFRYGKAWSVFPQYAHTFGAGLGAQFRGRTTMNDDWLNAQVSLFTTLGSDFKVESFNDVATLLNYNAEYQNTIDWLGSQTRLSVSFANQLGILENRVAITKNLTPVLRRNEAQRTLTWALVHNDRIHEAAFRGTSVFAWSSSPTLTGVLGYRKQKVNDFVSAQIEAGSTFKGNASNLRAWIKAQKMVSIGKSQLYLRGMVGKGSNTLTAQKRFMAGSADLENAWRNDAYRTAAAWLQRPAKDAHFFAFSGVGTVGYLYNAERDLSADDLVAASAQWEMKPLPKSKILSPLSLQLFSNVAYNSNLDKAIADGGVGASFQLAALTKLNRWLQQSDALSGMNIVYKIPFFVSHPDLIGETEKMGFRWILGIETGF